MRNPSRVGTRSLVPRAWLAALLLGAAAGASPVPAPASPQGAEPGSEAETQADGELGRSLRRILHLRGGGTLRAVARLGAGGWEVRSGAGWRALPAAAVESAVLEREVLAESKRVERSLGAAPGARVQLAAWMLEHGLLEEAVAELDRVLEREPLNAEAVALVGSRRLFAVPSASGADHGGGAAAARAALVSWAVGASPAMREAACQELARGDAEALRAELREALSSNVLTRRAFAAQALGRLFAGEELKNLLVLAVLDPAEDVRRHASVALSATGEPGVAAPVVRALGSPNPRVRVQAAEALGHMGFTAAVEPLIASLAASAAQGSGGVTRVPHSYIFVGRQFAYVQDFDVEVAQFQAVADPQVNVLLEGDVLEAGVHAVTSYGAAYESKAIRGALGTLTGQNPGYTARAWLDWWDEHGESWRTPPAAAEPAASTR